MAQETTTWLGGTGNVTDATNWNNGAPESGWIANIHGGNPIVNGLAIQDLTINIFPHKDVQANVQLDINRNSSLSANSTLNIESTFNAAATTATLFFGNIQTSGGFIGGSFVNAGTININPTNGAIGTSVNFALSGGQTPFQLTNAGTINVNGASLNIYWASAGSGLRPFVVNSGHINVTNINPASFTSLNAAGQVGGDPAFVVGINNTGTISFHGAVGAPGQTVGSFNIVQGTGSISIEDATVNFAGDVANGTSLRFIADPLAQGIDNILNLNETKASFGSTIHGFGAGDRINLGAAIPSGQFSYDTATGVMKLTTAGGATVTLHFAGNYQASSFELVQDKNGLSSIVAAPSHGHALSDALAGMLGQQLHDAAPLPAATIGSVLGAVEHLAGLGGLFAALAASNDAAVHGIAAVGHSG